MMKKSTPREPKRQTKLQTKIMLWTLGLSLLLGGFQIVLISRMTTENVPASIEMEIIRPTMQSEEALRQNNQVATNQTGLRSELEKLVQKQMRVISITSLISLLVVGGLGSLFVSKQVSKPLTQLSNQISSINANSLETRLSMEGSEDEVGHMAWEINKTLDRLERSFRSQEQFVLDAAHELRTPVTTLLIQNEALQSKTNNQEKIPVDLLATQKNNLIRMEDIVEDLLLLAKGERQAVKENINLTELVAEVCLDLTWLARKQKVILDFQPDEACIVSANPIMIDRMARNLIINAIQYNREGGRVSIQLSQRNNQISLQIQDTGIGISESELPFIFDRFYRGDPSRSRKTGGTGLGLAIVKHIVETCSAEIYVESEVGTGSTFTIIFLNEI